MLCAAAEGSQYVITVDPVAFLLLGYRRVRQSSHDLPGKLGPGA